MAVWEKAKIEDGAPGSRAEADDTGASWIRFLSPSFRSNDGVDYGAIGHGLQVIFGGAEVLGGGGGTAGESIGLLLALTKAA